MNNKYELACFDMDGTLLRNMNSVEFLCCINGSKKEYIEINKLEDTNEVSWIEGDYLKANLVKGLKRDEIKTNFHSKIKIISNLEFVLDYLKLNGIKSILITSGPLQVAQILGEKYGFEEVFGSQWEISDGRFTGKILEHLGESGKLSRLKSFCIDNDINPKRCIAIGDSTSDIEIFKFVSKSIAINYSDALIGKATKYIKQKI